MPDFFTLLTTSLGEWGIYAGMEGVEAVRFRPEPPFPSLPEVPYDVQKAWGSYESGLSDSLHLPLDLKAPPRVQLLYLQVRRIPRGETCPLGTLSGLTGIPAEEAAAHLSACPLPLAIPVHRVTGWDCPDPEVRDALLALEKEHPRLERVRRPWIHR